VKLVPLALATLAVPAVWGRPFTWFGAGLTLGLGVAVLLVAWDLPAPDVLKWGRGAAGERRTGELLKELEVEGWQVRHDLEKVHGGNADHVLVGPRGIFLLETKNLSGRVAVENGVLTVRSLDDDETVSTWRGLRGRVLADAAALATEIGRSARVRPWVHAVVVIWGRFPQQVVQEDRITYVHGDELADWLRSRAQIAQEIELVA
jgi:hypothetical protein